MSAPGVLGGRPPIEEMVVMHRAFRREFRLLPSLVRHVPPGAPARAAVVGKHARLILSMLHMHHGGEDAMLWPLLLVRTTPEREVVKRMQNQHEHIKELGSHVEPLVDRFLATAERRDELASALEQFGNALLGYLDGEESWIFPLVERHLSPSEWAAVCWHGLAVMNRRQLSLIFGALLEDAHPAERAMLLKTIPLLIRSLLRTLGAWQYRRYISRVRQGLT